MIGQTEVDDTVQKQGKKKKYIYFRLYT